MGADYGSGTRCVRWLFVICNFIFLVFGALAFAIGVWGVVVGSDYAVITGSDTVSAAALLLVGGIITLAVATVGIIGACAMWRPLLVIYAISISVIVVLEFVAAILAFVYVDDITDEIRGNMEDAIRDYRLDSDEEGYDSDINNAVENVQGTVECCGVDNATDWIILNEAAFSDRERPPANCDCNPDNDDECTTFTGTINGISYNFDAWEDGCAQKLEDNLEPVVIAIGVIAIIFAAVEILLLLIALGLCCCIYSAHRQSVV